MGGCGENNREGELICQHCGSLMAYSEQITEPVQSVQGESTQTPWARATTRIATGQLLSMVLQADCWTCERALYRGKSILLGRYNKPETLEQEAVDLVDAGGNERGVSRRHALIKVEQAAVFLIDLNSRNGTFLNGHRLQPQFHHLLGDGDLIRLGGLELRVQIT